MAHIVDSLTNEEARLNALRDLRLLDTPPSETFDRLTRLASQLLSAPVSTVSLTDRDRQWFKSKVGVDLTEIPREQAPCNYAIQGSNVFVVPDLQADPRFVGSPLAQAGIRFYAGAPLITRSGHGLGTICVVDDKCRTLADGERRILEDLAGLVMSQIELQNTIGRVDATSGYANQHQFFEDLEDQTRCCAGLPSAAVIVEFSSSAEVTHALRVLGSAHADLLTKRAMQVMQHQIGNSARLYHVGQMRCVVLCEAGSPTTAPALSVRIMAALAQPIFCDGVPVTLSPAIGCYDFVASEVMPQDVLRHLLSAGDDARNAVDGCASYDPTHDQQKTRSFALLNDFRAALAADDQLHVVFQPRVELATGQMPGVEALLRWQHPSLGNVPPGEFIPLIEQTALIRPLTDWVLVKSIAQARAWNLAGLDIRVSVNASALNLDEKDFAERLLQKVREAGLSPQHLELEFTESAVARNPTRVVEQLRALKEAGIAIAIDDFGTGYSNLAYIRQLPISILKIDRSFVMDLPTSQTNKTLVRTIITMAHDLGYRVVAEGIEDRQTYDLLTAWGCDEGQGYHMAKPMPARGLPGWMLTATHRAAA